MKKMLSVMVMALVMLLAISVPALASAPQSSTTSSVLHASHYADALFGGDGYSGEVKAWCNKDRGSRAATSTWGLVSTPRGLVQLYKSENEYQTPTRIPNRNFRFEGMSMKKAELMVPAFLYPSDGKARVRGTMTIHWRGYGDIHTFYSDSTGQWRTRHANVTVIFRFPVRHGTWTYRSSGGYLDAEVRYVD